MPRARALRRNSRALAGAAALVLAFAPTTRTPSQDLPAQDPARAEEELDLVVVTGERPGPALWKVTHKDHVLWILPVMAPLPREMVWRSRQVEEVIAQSQQIITAGGVTLQLGGNGADDVRVFEALLNPDGKALRDTVPAALYARFEALGQRYAGPQPQLQRMRPFYAGHELRKAAMRQLQLDSDGQVHSTIRRVARRHGITPIGWSVELKPRVSALVRRLKGIPPAADQACLRLQLDLMEQELREAVARANAWSNGDLAALKRDWDLTRRQNEANSCTPLLQQLGPTERAVRAVKRKEFSEIEKSLKKNRSTLALVRLEDVFDPQGVVAKLRRAGYGVEEPRVQGEGML